MLSSQLLRSARNAGLETCVMRLGQLCGDDKTGSWSKSDWIPAVIASSVSIKCLPAAIGVGAYLFLCGGWIYDRNARRRFRGFHLTSLLS